MKEVFILANTLLILLLIYYLYKSAKLLSLKKFLIPALLFKVFAGIGLGFLYQNHYHGKGDTIDFHRGSVYATTYFSHRPLKEYKEYLLKDETIRVRKIRRKIFYKNSRVFFFVKILSIVNFFTYKNYWLNSIYLSLFSFVGAWYLSNFLVVRYSISKIGAAFSFLLVPSIVLWSSGVLKESIVYGALCLLLYLLLKNFDKEKIKVNVVDWIGMLLCCYVIGKLKYYYLAVLLPIVIAYLVSQRFSFNNTFKKVSIFFGLLIVFLVIPGFFHPNLTTEYFADVLIENYNTIHELSHNKNVFYFGIEKENYLSFVKAFPLAVFTGLFRPLFPEALGGFSTFLGIENLAVFLLFIVSLWSVYINSKGLQRENILPFLSLMFYVLILAYIIPIASPNWGSLVRYRLGYFPFFLLLISANNTFFKKLDQIIKL